MAAPPLLRWITRCFGSLVVTSIFLISLFTYWNRKDEVTINAVADRIVAGEHFNVNVLDDVIARSMKTTPLDAWKRPRTLKSLALVRLSLVEAAASRGSLDPSQVSSLERSLAEALAYAPTDSFCWFAMFLVSASKVGYTEQTYNFLRMSYNLGPNEGWLALRRNSVSLLIYNQLPVDLAENARREFSALARSKYYVEVTNLLEGVGWPIRHQLADTLINLDDLTRATFARHLRDRGLDDIKLPGMRSLPDRPWN